MAHVVAERAFQIVGGIPLLYARYLSMQEGDWSWIVQYHSFY